MSRVPSQTTVAVLLGGWSAEREVSLSSGKACTAALERAGFKTVPIDVKRESVVADLQRVKPDVAFNALHGKWGEDGCCAAILETLQIPYTHSGVLASSLAMHKEKSKTVFRAAGVPVAAIPKEGDTATESLRSQQWRDVGVGAQILKDLGISSIRLQTSSHRTYVGLGGFGIEITGTDALEG